MEELILAGCIVALGQFVYAIAGFGSGMVSISLYALAFGDLRFFVPVFLLLCLPTELGVTFQTRKQGSTRQALWILALATPTLLLGAWGLGRLDTRILALLLGVVIAVLALYYLVMERGRPIGGTEPGSGGTAAQGRLPGIFMVSMSLVAGLLGGLFGVAGPPLIVYFKSLKLDKTAFRASLIRVWLGMSLLKVFMYAGMGLFSLRSLIVVAWLLPASWLGAVAGMKAQNRLSEAHFRVFTSLLLLTSGLLLVWKNVQ